MKRVNGVWYVKVNGRWIESGDIDAALTMLAEAYWGIK